MIGIYLCNGGEWRVGVSDSAVPLLVSGKMRGMIMSYY